MNFATLKIEQAIINDIVKNRESLLNTNRKKHIYNITMRQIRMFKWQFELKVTSNNVHNRQQSINYNQFINLFLCNSSSSFVISRV
jgi:hypothetical protein